MKPSPSELVRTLVRGRLPGKLRFGHERAPIRISHSTDAAGRPLILARDGDELTRVVSRWHGPGDPTVELSVADVPPVHGAPSLGYGRVTGRIHRLDEADAAATVTEFAESNPSTELLNVGRGVAMYLVDVDRA